MLRTMYSVLWSNDTLLVYFTWLMTMIADDMIAQNVCVQYAVGLDTQGNDINIR